jgi:Flp pilus assembly protein TadG
MSFLRDKRGQVLLIIALMMPILILAAALAVDSGNAFVTKSRLTKSVDAACLAGMKNLAQGQSTATTIATHIFNANYGGGAPTPTITFPTDSYGDQQVKVTATSNVPTAFAKLLFPTWTVADTAVATRGRLVMSIVLDKSGSMGSDGGMTALKSAVPTFIDYFDDTQDYVALITFGSNSTINFPMAHTFKTTITSDVNALSAGGGTFGSGGTYVATDGPPMTLADNQINSIAVVGGQNIVRVMVYFTDGLMNTIQDSFTCYTSSTNHVTAMFNYGGYDPTTNEVDVFNPPDGTDWCPGEGTGSCVTNDTTCTGGANPACKIVYDSHGDVCQNPYNTNVTKFPSAQYGQTSINRANVTAEAQYRALQTAATMRGETPGIYIYTIGLGSGVSATTQTFLKEVANDPSAPTYNSNLPQGEFFYVPDCPSSNCTTELQTAFQIIASKVLLRLTQ